jgi:hypothetical protein
MTTTDALKRALAEQVDSLRPVLDGARKPSGLRCAVWFNPDGTMREVELEPVFKQRYGERR